MIAEWKQADVEVLAATMRLRRLGGSGIIRAEDAGMPMNDWTRVPSGLFHDFHQAWSIEIRNALNKGIMPKGFYALVEQKVDVPEPDVIAVEMKKRGKPAAGRRPRSPRRKRP